MSSYSTSCSPLVSVVIPTKGEGASLHRCVRSVLRGNYPLERIELLIVDGGGDGAPSGLDHWRTCFYRAEVVDNPRGVTPVGMNLGIEAARGEFVLILGAHSAISPNYLVRAVAALHGRPLACVGGVTRAIGHESWLGKSIAVALTSRFGVGNAKFRYMTEPMEVDTVAFGVYPRVLFDQVGLFDERLVRNQDIEFNYRARRDHGPMLLDPEMFVEYYCRKDLLSLSQQAFQNGFWNVVTWRLVPGSLGWRHFVPLAFVLALVCGLGLGLLGTMATSVSSTFFWWPLLLLFLLYLLSATVVTGLWAKQHGIWAVLPLPITFFALHVSYGTGSLWGVVTAGRAGGSV